MRVALVHGFAGDPAAWDEVIARLPAGVDARAVALPGHGGGPVRDTWADNLDATADALGAAFGAAFGAAPGAVVEAVDLVVGYSLGARVALGLLAARRIPRAILVGVNPGLDDAERAARRAGDGQWARLLRERGIAAFAGAWAAQPLFASQAGVEPARLAARRARRLALDAAALARSLEVMGLAEMPDHRAALALALAEGRAELVAGADDARYVALARAAAAPVTLIPACGHDPTLEQPAALAALIAARATRA